MASFFQVISLVTVAWSLKTALKTASLGLFRPLFCLEVNFTDLSKFKFNIDPVLGGAAKYYVLGAQDGRKLNFL